MIDLRLDEEQLERTIQRARERNIIIPAVRQQKNPELVPVVSSDACVFRWVRKIGSNRPTGPLRHVAGFALFGIAPLDGP